MHTAQAADKRYICRFSVDMATGTVVRLNGKGIKDAVPDLTLRKQPTSPSAPRDPPSVHRHTDATSKLSQSSPSTSSKTGKQVGVLKVSSPQDRQVKIGSAHQTEIPALRKKAARAVPASAELVWEPQGAEHAAEIVGFLQDARVAAGLEKGTLVFMWNSAKLCYVPAIFVAVIPGSACIEVRLPSTRSCKAPPLKVDVALLRFGGFHEDAILQQLHLSNHNTKEALFAIEGVHAKQSIYLHDNLLWTWADSQLLERYVATSQQLNTNAHFFNCIQR